MTNEEIIRSEARIAATHWDTARHRSHEKFIEFIKEELRKYYAPNSKALFLDEIKNQIAHLLVEHKKHCNYKGEGQCPTDEAIEKGLFFIQQEIDELPKIIHENSQSNADRDTVFISYSHQDKAWLDILKRHFKPLESRIDFWDDSRIKPGQKWKGEIEAAISRAKVALLLVSADFFNSEFITKKEIPPLLEAANRDGATILFLVLKPCLIEEYPQLLEYQGLNAPSKPFIRMDEADREDLCVSMVKQIRDTLTK